MGSMAGKTCVVTGSTSGIGQAIATELARQGARVVLAGHEREQGERAREQIVAQTGNELLELEIADFSTLGSVRSFASAVAQRHAVIDVLCNNAGMITTQRPQTTADGLEKTWAVNYFAPFLLTHALLPRVQAAPQGRIVNTASVAHRWGRLPSEARHVPRRLGPLNYFDTKLALVHFTRALARRLAGGSTTCNCFHPGIIGTGLGAGRGVIGRLMKLSQPLMKTPEQGAATGIYLAADDEVREVSGEYFVDGKVRAPSRKVHDERADAALWSLSVEVTGEGADG